MLHVHNYTAPHLFPVFLGLHLRGVVFVFHGSGLVRCGGFGLGGLSVHLDPVGDDARGSRGRHLRVPLVRPVPRKRNVFKI